MFQLKFSDVHYISFIHFIQIHLYVSVKEQKLLRIKFSKNIQIHLYVSVKVIWRSNSTVGISKFKYIYMFQLKSTPNSSNSSTTLIQIHLYVSVKGTYLKHSFFIECLKYVIYQGFKNFYQLFVYFSYLYILIPKALIFQGFPVFLIKKHLVKLNN